MLIGLLLGRGCQHDTKQQDALPSPIIIYLPKAESVFNFAAMNQQYRKNSLTLAALCLLFGIWFGQMSKARLLGLDFALGGAIVNCKVCFENFTLPTGLVWALKTSFWISIAGFSYADTVKETRNKEVLGHLNIFLIKHGKTLYGAENRRSLNDFTDLHILPYIYYLSLLRLKTSAQSRMW